mgnify:FL=1
MSKLAHETAAVQSELDSILAQAKVDPLSRVGARPLAPRPQTAAERRMLRPILVEHSASQKASPFPAFPSLIESTSTASAKTVPNIFPTEGGYIHPDLNLPAPEEAVFQQERRRFNSTAPTDLELRLRKVYPKQVVLESHPGQVEADMMINANEIMPRDPNTEAMLQRFNVKYGVAEGGSGVPNTDLPASDLQDIEDREGINEVQSDYRSIYDSMNQNIFDVDSISVEDIDKRLGALWNKRWEYLEAERVKANELVAKGAMGESTVDTYAVDPLFVSEVKFEDEGASINSIITRNEMPQQHPVVDHIPDRTNFVPEINIEGPNVIAVSVDRDSIPDPAKEFFTPDYNAPFKHEAGKMTIIPSNRVLRNRFRKLGFRNPEFKAGDEFDFNAAVNPAIEGKDAPFSFKQNDHLVDTNY